MTDTLREKIARATWEQWRALEIAAESCRDLSFDDLIELNNAPALTNGHQPAKQILDAALIQAGAALAAIEAAGWQLTPAEPILGTTSSETTNG